VLISSVLAAPVNRRSGTRQTIARRSVQAVFSRPSPNSMPSVEARMYRRMALARDDPLEGAGPSKSASDDAPNNQPSEEPSPELPPSLVPEGETLPATLPATLPPTSTTTPTNTASDDLPAATPNSQVPPPEINPGDPIPQPGPHPNLPNPAGNQTQTAEGDKVQQVPPSATVNAPSAVVDAPSPIAPVQAPFAAPKSKAIPTAAVKEALEEPSSSPLATSTVGEPTFTTPAPAATDVPIPHGTEGTWGGTLVNSTGGTHSPQSGAGKEPERKPLTLSGVIRSLIFDVVYGRFLF